VQSLSVLQLAILTALLGSLGAVFVPEFTKNLHASRLAEPLEGLAHLSGQAMMHAATSPTVYAYPTSAPRTPAEVPNGKGEKDPEGTWSHPTWKLLGFEQTEEHFFSFEFESTLTAGGSHFVARAFGDLDGDGELSHFEVFGESRVGQEPRTYPVRMHREVE
jgi:hypothetical protein